MINFTLGGLTAWGLVRYSANSSSSQLTLDAPLSTKHQYFWYFWQ
jgi:hypothetical protein